MKKIVLCMILVLCAVVLSAQDSVTYSYEKFTKSVKSYTPEGFMLLSCENSETEYTAIFMKGFEGILSISMLIEEHVEIEKKAIPFTLHNLKAYYMEEETDDGMFGMLIVHYPQNSMYVIIMEAPINGEEAKTRLITHYNKLKF